jgi:uncharacterized protein YbjT (DUF2867 family)
VVSQLVAAGEAVRAVVRKPDRAASVEQVVGDLDRPETLSGAFTGARGVFLLGGYRDMPGVLAAIRAAGVEQVVLLSSRSVIGGAPDNAVVAIWLASEAAVRASQVPWTILRPSGFMSNALRWLPQLRAGDVVRAPFAAAPIAAIDPRDIAAVAALALTQPGHRQRTHVLTGPEPLLPAQQVRILARVLGRDLRFEAQPDDEARAEMSKSTPAPFVDAFFRFFVGGEFDDAPVLPTVEALTRRPPRTFAQWAAAHKGEFASDER